MENNTISGLTGHRSVSHTYMYVDINIYTRHISKICESPSIQIPFLGSNLSEDPRGLLSSNYSDEGERGISLMDLVWYIVQDNSLTMDVFNFIKKKFQIPVSLTFQMSSFVVLSY